MAKENAPTAEKTCQKNACEKYTKTKRFLSIWGAFWDPPGSPKCSQNRQKTFFFVSSFFAKSTSRRPEPQDPPRSDFWLILAHPSDTFFWKQRFRRVEGVRHGTFADAHPPRENLVFSEKLWKGVPKSTPGSILGRFWHTLPRLFVENKILDLRSKI